MDQALIRALKARNVDVITVLDTQTEGQLDDEQLKLASSQKRVLYSHNIADFCRIHSEFIAQDRFHSGIALLSQDYSVGQQLRGILELTFTHSAEDMQNQLIFLSQYLRFD
jgi:hypothetical protein